jgi:hypothetical protein
VGARTDQKQGPVFAANSAVEMDIMRFLWDLYSVSPDRHEIQVQR